MKGIFRMKPKVYYYFKESIKNRKDYLRRMRDYFFYREMYVTSKNMLFKKKPITSLLLWLINLPINTWRYIIFLDPKCANSSSRVGSESRRPGRSSDM